ncbi:hypothetical protein CYMTET_18036 [Cymbomonas tetramitiformis]|uniref:Tudor domain-containing protein n=1 Tax=Cymbomonas tetramitiformis TaxID=36881 RepID=A0AAE0G9B4_9CHLO|nr:hypothetical protein CYMTET_18036 [Cymbomonas tetramitiformis]
MARGGRQFRGDAMDYSRGEVEVVARASVSVRPQGVTEGCYAAAAGVVGRGEGKAATERCLDESDEKISCFSRFFSAETGYEQVETGGGLPMAEPVVCEKSREDGDAEETKETGETGRLYDIDGQSVAGPVVLAGTRTVTAECEYYRTWTIIWCWSTLSEKAHRLGLRRNEKKGQWEPTQVVEHLGLEAACDEQVERAQDLEIPDESEDEMHNWHITHLELEAVYKTVQAFLQELEGKVVRLYFDNKAVVAMLSHFTSRNPDLMRRMRRLWLLLDLHDIELQARYIRNEANVWADNLSRCEDLDDWRLNRDWFVWANKQWGPYTVDRFASEISAQLPRYYAAWKDPRCEGVDSLTYDWRGENNWVNPPWALLDEVAHKLREEGAAATVVAPYWPGQSWFRELEALATEVVIMPRRRDLFTPSRLGGSELLGPSNTTASKVTVGSKIEVFWKDDDCFYPGVVKEFNEDGKAHVLYDDGDEETLDLSEENFKIINSVSELTDEATDADGENIERISGGDYEEYKRGGAVQNFLTRSLCERWRGELGPSRLTELAVTMQRKALLDTTMSNYGPKARRFILFCEQHQRPWLPASEATVLLYIASLLKDGGIKSASLRQPYLFAINNYHEDLRFPGPAKGRSVTRAVKGMATIQAELAVQEENIETQRTWLPAAHGVALLKELIEHWEFHRDTAWNSSEKTQPDAYWLLPEDPKNFKASVANDWIGLALNELDCRPPEGGHFSAHSTRKGATPCARAVGVAMEKVCFLGGWSQFSSAVQHYIDPTALRDTYMDYNFACSVPFALPTAPDPEDSFLLTSKQAAFVDEFQEYLKGLRRVFQEAGSGTGAQGQMSLQAVLKRQQRLLRGETQRELRNIPKVVWQVCEALIAKGPAAQDALLKHIPKGQAVPREVTLTDEDKGTLEKIKTAANSDDWDPLAAAPPSVLAFLLHDWLHSLPEGLLGGNALGDALAGPPPPAKLPGPHLAVVFQGLLGSHSDLLQHLILSFSRIAAQDAKLIPVWCGHPYVPGLPLLLRRILS